MQVSMIADVFALLNMALAAMLIIFGVRTFRIYRGQPWRWLILSKMIMGAYWAGVYAWVLVTEPGSFSSVLFGQLFIRPALTITIALMAAGVVMGAKRQ